MIKYLIVCIIVINNYNNNNNEKLVNSRKILKWKKMQNNCTARNKLIQVVINSMTRNESNSVHSRITASP